MSDSRNDESVRGEIQKLLVRINEDMKELKNELFLLNRVVEENQSLSITSEFVNEKLKIAAKEAGIDLDDLSSNEDVGNSKEDEEDQSSNSSESNSNQSSPANSDTIEAATKKLTEKVKNVLKK